MEENTVNQIFSTTAPLKEDGTYLRSMQHAVIRFRWVNANMCEIKLPSGKTLITDPFFTDALPGQGFAELPFEISIDDFDACDYIFLNHAHPDHYLNLKEFVDKFHPLIFVDGHYAAELSHTLDIDLAYIYPVDVGHTYTFRDFKLSTYHGIHNEIKGINFGNYAYTEKLFGIRGTEALDQYGSLFNTSFMLTLPDGFKIGFAPGEDMFNLAEEWRNNKPNLLLRQRMVYATTETYAEDIAMLGGQIVMPIHHETAFASNADMNAFAEGVNEILQRKNVNARMLNPQRMKWYKIQVGMDME